MEHSCSNPELTQFVDTRSTGSRSCVFATRRCVGALIIIVSSLSRPEGREPEVCELGHHAARGQTFEVLRPVDVP